MVTEGPAYLQLRGGPVDELGSPSEQSGDGPSSRPSGAPDWFSTGGTPGRSFVVVWALSALLLLLLATTWSAVTPLYGGPSEPAQVLRSAAVVRGQWTGSRPANHPHRQRDSVRVPASLVLDRGVASCFAGEARQPAGCAHWSTAGGAIRARPTTAPTFAANYPPLYYGLVGWPSLWNSGPGGIRLMRIVSAAISSALLGLAFASVARWGGAKSWAAGIALATTPMELFLTGVVNPMAVEIAAATSAWVAGLLLAWGTERTPRTSLVTIFGISSTTAVLAAPLGPLWVGIMTLFVFALAPAARRRTLVRSVAVRRIATFVGAALVVGAGWDAAFGVVGDPQTSTVVRSGGSAVPRVLVASAHEVGYMVQQMIGVLGANDTVLPNGVYFTWLAATGALVFSALAWAPGRQRAGVAASAALVSLVPILIVAVQAGMGGRTTVTGAGMLPLAVALPLVAGAALARGVADSDGAVERIGHRLVGRVASVIGMAVVACDATAFVAVYRRFSVGTSGPLDPFASVPGGWQPPVPGVLLSLTSIAAATAVVAWLAFVSPPRGWEQLIRRRRGALAGEAAGIDPERSDHGWNETARPPGERSTQAPTGAADQPSVGEIVSGDSPCG